MAEFVASGRIIDVIVLMMAAEAVLLYLHGRRTGRGLALPDIVINLVAGGSLMLAIRGALTDAGAGWILACLSVSLCAHIADVARRWRDGDGPLYGTRAPRGPPAAAIGRVQE